MVNEALMKIHVLLGPLAHFSFYKSLLLHSIGKNQSHSPSTCKGCGGCEMWPVAGQGNMNTWWPAHHVCQSSKDQISIWIFFYSIISHLFSQGFCCHSIHYKLPKCFPFSSSLPGLTPFFSPCKSLFNWGAFIHRPISWLWPFSCWPNLFVFVSDSSSWMCVCFWLLSSPESSCVSRGYISQPTPSRHPLMSRWAKWLILTKGMWA